MGLGLVRTMLGVLGTAAIAAIAFKGGKDMFVKVYAQADPSVRPYVMEQWDFVVEDNGAEVITARNATSRRRDASRHSLTMRTIGSRTIGLRRVDFADGRESAVIDAIGAKMTGLTPEAERASEKAWLLNPPPQCASSTETVDREETLFGQRAIKILSGASRGVRWTFWRLPDFNCETIQVRMEERDSSSGVWRLKAGKRLMSFAETDPDPALFSNWSGYREMKPSDLKREMYSSDGVTPEICPACFADEPALDRRYAESRQALARREGDR